MVLPNETTPRTVPDEWYYSDGNDLHGPLSSRQLADLAVRGCVRRDYPVKKGSDGNWHLASQVKGLIFAPEVHTQVGIEAVNVSPPPLPTRQEPTTHPIDNRDPAVVAADNRAAVIRLPCRDDNPLLQRRRSRDAGQGRQRGRRGGQGEVPGLEMHDQRQ